jgi:hypothetical protein
VCEEVVDPTAVVVAVAESVSIKNDGPSSSAGSVPSWRTARNPVSECDCTLRADGANTMAESTARGGRLKPQSVISEYTTLSEREAKLLRWIVMRDIIATVRLGRERARLRIRLRTRRYGLAYQSSSLVVEPTTTRWSDGTDESNTREGSVLRSNVFYGLGRRNNHNRQDQSYGADYTVFGMAEWIKYAGRA